MHRHIAGRLTGRYTKWVVLVFWVLALFIAAPFAGKLTGVQDNQASSWLPASAESTKALSRLNAFQDQDDIPTTVVWRRPSGLTQADLGRIASQVGRMEQIRGAVAPRTPQGDSPPPEALVQTSGDGQVAQAVVTFNFGPDGWNKLP